MKETKICRKCKNRKKTTEFRKKKHTKDGLKHYPQGFRIFRQRTYEWYEPLNIEVAKIAEKKK